MKQRTVAIKGENEVNGAANEGIRRKEDEKNNENESGPFLDRLNDEFRVVGPRLLVRRGQRRHAEAELQQVKELLRRARNNE